MIRETHLENLSSIGFGVTVSRDTAHPVFEKDLDAHWLVDFAGYLPGFFA